jgi:hypothetical protein
MAIALTRVSRSNDMDEGAAEGKFTDEVCLARFRSNFHRIEYPRANGSRGTGFPEYGY